MANAFDDIVNDEFVAQERPNAFADMEPRNSLDKQNAFDDFNTTPSKNRENAFADLVTTKDQGMKFGDSAKGVVGSVIDTVANLTEGSTGAYDFMARRQIGASNTVLDKVYFYKNNLTGEVKEVTSDKLTSFAKENSTDSSKEDIRGKLNAAGKFDLWSLEDVGEYTKEVTDRFIDTAGNKAKELGSKAYDKIQELKPASIQEAQNRVRVTSGNEDLPWYKSSWAMVIDNAGNLVSGAVNPQFAYASMYSAERKSMKDELISSGVSEDIANEFASIYGGTSAPIEYTENAGRLVGAFGRKAKKKAISVASIPIKRAINEILKNAGMNIVEEVSQEALFNAIYNAAIKQSNEKNGTQLEAKTVWDNSEMWGVAKGSLGMSAILDAMGIPVRYSKYKSRSSHIRKNLESAGVKPEVATEYSKKFAAAKNQEEMDLIKDEMYKDRRLNTVIDAKDATRLQEIMSKNNPTDEEIAELDKIVSSYEIDSLSQVEEFKLKSDVKNLSKTDPLIMSPDSITDDVKIDDENLKVTAERLSEIYGREVTPEEVKDAFADTYTKEYMPSANDRAEAANKGVENVTRLIDRFRSGKAKFGEVTDALADINPALIDEFNERTTGDQSEPVFTVLDDILTRTRQEAENGTKREQTTRTEPESKTIQEQSKTEAETVPTEEGEVARNTDEQKKMSQRQTTGEQLSPISKVEKDQNDQTPVQILKDVYPPNPQLPEVQWRKEMADFAVKAKQSGMTKNQFVSDMEADYLHKDFTAEDLADIWADATVEAKRIEVAQKTAEKANLKGDKLKQKIKPKAEKIVVDVAKATRDWFKVQEKASKIGKKVGLKEGRDEIRAKFKAWRDNADAFRGEFRESIKGMRGATKLERTELRALMYKLYEKKTAKSQEVVFEELMNKLEDVKNRIQYEYRPFTVTKDEKYQSVRERFLTEFATDEAKLGRRITSKKEMMDYLSGKKVFSDAIIDEMKYAETGDIAGRVLRGADSIKNMLKFGAAMSTRIQEKAAPVMQSVYKVEYLSNQYANEDLKRAKNFIDTMAIALKKAKGIDKLRLISDISNVNADAMEKAGIQDLEIGREILDKYAKDFGIPTNQKYFPRIVEDLEGLQRALEMNPKGEYERAIKEGMTAKQRRAAIRGANQKQSSTVASNFKKERKIDEITPDIAKFYVNPADAFVSRIRQMARAKAMNEVMGIEPTFKDSEISDPNIEMKGKDIILPDQIQAMIDDVGLTPSEQKEIQSMLNIWLAPKRQSDSSKKFNRRWRKAIAIKNVSQLETTALQLADAGVTLAENGIENFSSTITRKGDLAKWKDEVGQAVSDALEEYGIDKFADIDLQNLSVKQIDKVFAPLRFLDDQQKRTLLVSTMNKWNRQAKSNPSKLKKELEAKFGTDKFVDRVIESSAKGVMNQDVRLALFMHMAGFHPTTNMEMIALQANNPDIAILFALKSFALKRYDRLYRTVLRDFVDGTARLTAGTIDGNSEMQKDGAQKLASSTIGASKYLAGTLATEAAFRYLMNMFKQELTGDDDELDYFDNLLSETVGAFLPLVSLYSIREAMKTGDATKITDAVTTGATPAGFSTARATWLFLKGEDDKALKELYSDIPVIGRMLSRWQEGNMPK